jgi:hypothetical protein
VLKAQHESVCLPIIRKAVADTTILKPGTKDAALTVKAGQTVICDLYAAEQSTQASADETDYLSYVSSFTEKFAPYHPKKTAALSLTALVRALAQMKNLRRGHDRQGRPKKVRIDGSYEGYSNYMAPMRIKEIEVQVGRELEQARKDKDTKRVEELKGIFTTKVLKPMTDTHMTPEWDEYIPFPTSEFLFVAADFPSSWCCKAMMC